MQIFLAFSEYERDMIHTRMMEGKTVARQKDGYREGRPKKYTPKQLSHAMRLLDEGNSFKDIAETTGMSISTLAREARRRKAEKILEVQS